MFQPFFRNVAIAAALLLLSSFCSFAQFTDSFHIEPVKKDRDFLRHFSLPISLIGVGFYSSHHQNFIDHGIRDWRNTHYPDFNHQADTYLQFAPIAVVYGMDAIGLKGKHNWKQQTILLGGSQLLMMGILTPIKMYGHVRRPDSTGTNSFPSGHTAQAFLAATFFYKEFGKQYPWLSAGMYTIATGVGVMRVLNNKHWASDVLAGAGFGILSTELTYFLLTPKVKHSKALSAEAISSLYTTALIKTNP